MLFCCWLELELLSLLLPLIEFWSLLELLELDEPVPVLLWAGAPELELLVRFHLFVSELLDRNELVSVPLPETDDPGEPELLGCELMLL